MKAGDVYKTDFGGDCVVMDYINNHTVRVKFLDDFGYEKVVTKAFLEKGCIKNPYARKVFGLGYIGVGPYSIMGGLKHTLEYNTWSHMFGRCYSDQESVSGPSYDEANVLADFHCFQDFAFWANNQIGFGNKGWHLDKDLIVKGNKSYGADFCVFLPSEINNFLPNRSSKRGEYPLGVSKHKNGVIARCSNTLGLKAYLGYFSNPEDAFYCFKTQKEAIAKILAEKYKDQISNLAYEALKSFEVHITD